MRSRPDVVTRIKLPSGSVDVDEHGYITDPDLWTRDFARHTASLEGLTLTDAHFEIIDFMRDWLEDHGIMPDVRFILNYIRDRDGMSKSGAKDALFQLFPYGYVKQACKVAGMKQPRAWSTG